MVQVRVAGVALDEAGQHVLLIKPIDEPHGSGRMLPVWIGPLEATSILIAIEGQASPRPLAHDLMRSLLDAVGASVERVEITRVAEGTYYAEITIATAEGSRVVDARPSDAVALASRVAAPIHVADAVLDEAGVPDVTEEPEPSEAPEFAASGEDAERSVDEFKRFLNEVDPDDFRG